MWPCVKMAVSSRDDDHVRIVSWTVLAWKTPLVSTTTSPSSVSTAAELAKASTNARRGCTSASSPLEANPPQEATAAERVVAVLRRANASLRTHADVTAAMVSSIGSAQPENADIVRRVTEVMTATITNAIHARDHGQATDRELRVAR